MSKEKKVEDNLKELTKERLYKFSLIQNKRLAARDKASRHLHELENQSMRSYTSSLKELKIR
jgi:hypothetical protein